MSLFGEGIYLSSDLRVCQTYSPTGFGWNKSLFGTSLSCIAVCQVVDHPDVKCSVIRSSRSLRDASETKVSSSQSQLLHRTNRNTLCVNASSDSAQYTEIKTTVTDQTRSFIAGSEGGKVPDKYYVVRNDDLVRVKYLYVYAPNAQRDLINQILCGNLIKQPKTEISAFKKFVQAHKFFLVMFCYVLVLAFISFWNSKVLSKWWQNDAEK